MVMSLFLFLRIKSIKIELRLKKWGESIYGEANPNDGAISSN